MGEIVAEAVDACRFVQQQGHGTVHRCLPLKGTLTLPTGAAAPAWLCQTAKGAWVAAADGGAGKAVSVLDAHPVHYEERLLGDTLVVGLATFGVPYGKGAELKHALAMGRLLRDAQYPVYSDLSRPEGPWIEDMTAVEQVWLSGHIDPDDPILVWLHTGTSTPLDAPLSNESEAQWRLLITRDHALLVAVSGIGDTKTRPLPGSQPLEVTHQTGRHPVTCGEETWTSTVRNGKRFAEVSALPALEGGDRVREAARMTARTPRGRRGSTAEHLLAHLQGAEGPLDALYRASVPVDGTAEPEAAAAVAQEAVAALRLAAPDASPLADWLVGWDPPAALSQAVLAAALDASNTPEEAAWAVPFHRVLRDRTITDTDDRFARTEADIALAEHLLYAQQHAEAAQLLEPRLAALPDEDLVSVLPPADADLTSGQGGQPAHIRVLELLVAARGGPNRADLSTVAALARHQPLVASRLRALTETAGRGHLGYRAGRALDLMVDRGLTTSPTQSSGTVRALPPTMLDTVQHPVARAGGALGTLQAALAKVQPPDFGVLRGYCERLTSDGAADTVNAVADACTMLGLPTIPAFVSWGEKRVGVRSHEEPEPFLLVGGAHLDPRSAHRLSPLELRFAIASEVAHVRFEHSRVTSDDVWAGVWDKGATALTATATLLPFLRFLPVDLIGKERTYRAVHSVVPTNWLQAVYKVEDATTLSSAVGGNIGKLGQAGAGVADSAAGAMDKVKTAADWLWSRPGSQPSPTQDVGPDDSRLVAAHRIMQFTADRAGLLLCGDLGAALRAMLLSQTRFAPALQQAEEHGLSRVLAQRGPEGTLTYPGLAARVAALTAFWLSDDYARLRDALGATDHVDVTPSAPTPLLEPEEVPSAADTASAAPGTTEE